VDPAGQAHGLAGMGEAQFATTVGAVGMHELVLGHTKPSALEAPAPVHSGLESTARKRHRTAQFVKRAAGLAVPQFQSLPNRILERPHSS
jgi:hypothetical protein